MTELIWSRATANEFEISKSVMCHSLFVLMLLAGGVLPSSPITLSRHPQIRQREQREEVRGVFRQSAESHLHQAELALDHAKRVLDLRADAGLAVFRFATCFLALPSGSLAMSLALGRNVPLQVLALHAACALRV